MSNSKEIEFKINKNLKEYEEYVVSCIGEGLMYTPKYTEGKNFKADDFGHDLGVLSYCGMPFYRVSNKSKLKKDHYFVSDDGHYTFSRHNDDETVNIRYIEKEEEEKPKYIFGVGELKFSDEFKNDKAKKDLSKKIGECPDFSESIERMLETYLEDHGKYLSVPRAKLNITTPDAKSFKEKLAEVVNKKDEDLMIYNLGYNKRLVYSYSTFKFTYETPRKEFYDRILKFNGKSYDKLFEEEVIKVFYNKGICRGIGNGGISNIIDVIDDFEGYLKHINFGYKDYFFNFKISFKHYLGIKEMYNK